MKIIKNYFMKMRIEEASRQNVTARKTKTYGDTQQIGILFHIQSEEGVNELEQFIHTLKREGKKVSALAYIPPKESKVFDFNYFPITGKDFSITGQMNAYNVQEFIQTPFDYLYCISLDPLLEIEYVLASSKALCRIGPSLTNYQPHLEMMFAHPSRSETDLIRTFAHYTKSLKNNRQLAPVIS